MRLQSRVVTVSSYLIPAAKQSDVALGAFKEQIRAYEDAFSTGEESFVQSALVYANNVWDALQTIIDLKGLEEQKRNSVRKIFQPLKMFTASAQDYYLRICQKGGNLLTDAEQDEAHRLSQQIDIFREKLGFLQEEFADDLEQELVSITSVARRQGRTNAIIFVIVCVSTLTLIAIVIKRSIIHPLMCIVEIAEDVTAGKQEIEWLPESRDEIGVLNSSLRVMTEKLRAEITERERAEEELKKYRDHLEDLVKERTTELTRINTQLEQEITTRKRVEEELVKAKEQAESANRAKSDFLARMSHELRTLLNAILGYTQLFKRDQGLSDKQHEAVATIHRSGEHLLLLITDLLDLSKIEARKIELKSVSFPLPLFLKNLVETVRIRARQKGIRLDADVPADLPVGVSGDEHCLRQILVNLLDNAIKFTGQGRVTLRVKKMEWWSTGGLEKKIGVLEDWSAGGMADWSTGVLECWGVGNTSALQSSSTPILRFEVEDTGIGIPAEHLPHILLPFYQVGGARTGREGSGLGLAISQQLVRLMGSELHVQSTAGQGSVFWFDIELPIVADVIASPSTSLRIDSAQPSHPIIGFTGPSTGSGQGRRKILLVDDNNENRAFLRDVLMPLGFDLMEAVNGQEALDKMTLASDQRVMASDQRVMASPSTSLRIDSAKQSPPDLILMDLLMPVMDGFETTRQIRQTPDLSKVIIIGVSASASSEIRQKSLAAGCDDFLVKPVQIEELLDCLRRHLGLVWTYADTAESESEQQQPSALVVPPQDVLLKLLRFAEGGYINDLQASVAELKTLNVSFIPFAAKITELADNFQFKQIIELIKSFLVT
jgi:signal transduction histidine kinase/CheY-like chemotaxis protein